MKKWIVHIIHVLLHFLFGWLMGEQVKEVKYKNEKDGFDIIIVWVICAGLILIFSCLWRENIFRCGITALIH